MNKLQKIGLILSGAGMVLIGGAGTAGATIITFPSYSDVINATSTSFGSSLLTDLLPIAGALAVITIVGIVLTSLIKRALSALSKIAGGRRRRRGFRR